METKHRLLGNMAVELRSAASVARRAIASASGIDSHARDDAASELAQAVVLLSKAAARFDACCGVPDPAWPDLGKEKG